jgi:hypothetical protein
MPYFVNITDATITKESNNATLSCSYVSPETLGLWWRFDVTGTAGRCMSANFSKETSDKRVVALYKGDSCDSLTCFNQKEASDVVLMNWVAYPGDSYYVLAGSTGQDTAGPALFSLSVSLQILNTRIC